MKAVSFYGLMDEQSRTISGKIENIRDAWESMLNEVGQSQEGIIMNLLMELNIFWIIMSN